MNACNLLTSKTHRKQSRMKDKIETLMIMIIALAMKA